MGAVCPGCWQMSERKNGPVVVLEKGRKDPVGQSIWRWGPCAYYEMTERTWCRSSRGRMWVPSSSLAHSWWWGEEDAIVFASQGHWFLGMVWGQPTAKVGAQLGVTWLCWEHKFLSLVCFHDLHVGKLEFLSKFLSLKLNIFSAFYCMSK